MIFKGGIKVVKSHWNLDKRLEKEKQKLNEMVESLGCLNKETLKQSELVDRLIVLKMRSQVKRMAV